MKVVPTAAETPGCCLLTGRSDGPFVQLDRLRDDGMGTAYVRVEAIAEMARLLGMVPESEKLTVSEREALEARAQAAEDAHHELLQAVGTTLRHGAVVRKGHIQLREPYDRTGRKRSVPKKS